MLGILLIPLAIQGLVMVVDEGVHIKRGLPKWERIGHPVDTLSILLCMGTALFLAPSPQSLTLYLSLGVFSCLLVTKDEWVHREKCGAFEQWLHALLFILHPVILGGIAYYWWNQGDPFHLRVIAAVTFVWFLYQIIYWNIIWSHKTRKTRT